MVALIIPVLNGGSLYKECLEAVKAQTQPLARKIVMESGSKDGSKELSAAYDFELYDVPAGTFNHGGTRSDAVQKVDDDVIVFLTQDAILDDPGAIEALVKVFDDPKVGAAYGRQLAHYDASLFAQHARNTSYRAAPYVTTIKDAYPKGMRKCFISNSFAAYRREALEQVGGFPSDVILCEDMFVTAKMLKSDWKVAYAADARVRHSHNYTVSEEFRRYFDIGVFHNQQSWISQDFGTPEGEGVRVALDQIKFCAAKGAFLSAAKSVVMSGAKFIGYKLGLRHERLGTKWSRKLAMHRGYFKV